MKKYLFMKMYLFCSVLCSVSGKVSQKTQHRLSSNDRRSQLWTCPTCTVSSEIATIMFRTFIFNSFKSSWVFKFVSLSFFFKLNFLVDFFIDSIVSVCHCSVMLGCFPKFYLLIVLLSSSYFCGWCWCTVIFLFLLLLPSLYVCVCVCVCVWLINYINSLSFFHFLES